MRAGHTKGEEREHEQERLDPDQVPTWRPLAPLALALFVGLFASVSFGCATTTQRLGLAEPMTAEKVDVDRFLGTWYEIASIPKPHARGCTSVSDTYRRLDDGAIQIVSRCRVGKSEKRVEATEGRAVIADASNQSKLRVNFFELFWSDYWILDVGRDYEYAVVGDSTRDTLRILSRRKSIDPLLMSQILANLREQGYQTERLRPVYHEVSLPADGSQLALESATQAKDESAPTRRATRLGDEAR